MLTSRFVNLTNFFWSYLKKVFLLHLRGNSQNLFPHTDKCWLDYFVFSHIINIDIFLDHYLLSRVFSKLILFHLAHFPYYLSFVQATMKQQRTLQWTGISDFNYHFIHIEYFEHSNLTLMANDLKIWKRVPCGY